FAAELPDRPLLAINPHTTYPSKAWPEEYFVEFIKLWFGHTEKKVLVTWGPGEIEAAQRIIDAAGKEKCLLQPPVKIMEFADLLKRLDLFLTGDTGPMNIAWAVDTPTIALFGPTTRKAVAPSGDRHLTLFNPQVECLQCHLEQCSHKTCMYSMKPEWVFEQIKSKYNLK
ncbi:MAG: glycosyltransferase family 9 protein, partial [Candidatus Riflebacteria bacterium]